MVNTDGLESGYGRSSRFQPEKHQVINDGTVWDID